MVAQNPQSLSCTSAFGNPCHLAKPLPLGKILELRRRPLDGLGIFLPSIAQQHVGIVVGILDFGCVAAGMLGSRFA